MFCRWDNKKDAMNIRFKKSDNNNNNNCPGEQYAMQNKYTPCDYADLWVAFTSGELRMRAYYYEDSGMFVKLHHADDFSDVEVM